MTHFDPSFNYNQNQNNPYFMEMQRLAYYKQKRSRDIQSLLGIGVLLGAAILALLFMQVIIVSALQLTPYRNVYDTSAAFQNYFNVIAVHATSMLLPFLLFALVTKSKREGRPLVPLKKLGALRTSAWTGLGMGICLLANFAVQGIMKLVELLGYKLTQPEMLEPKSVFDCVSVVIATAVVPAIFEEFAFRCCALGSLRKYGKGFAVFAVSIVFGLVHGNVIQFIFAFILGLVFGYITIVTDSVLPAMLIHGFNNGLSATSEILGYTSSEKVSTVIVGIIVLFWIAAAFAGLVYLAVTKQLVTKEILNEGKVKEPYALSFGGKLACLAPGLFIPFVLLIFLTTKFIEKI